MGEPITYGFWFFEEKLEGMLHALSWLTHYEFIEDEIEAIRYGTTGTNDEENIWLDWILAGELFTISIRLARFDEDDYMIRIVISAPIELREKLEALDLFQCVFQDLKITHPYSKMEKR